jgi:hypothetical protein
MSSGPALAPDAAMALGLASTAMPFAGTPEGEAERWLRVLRLHGEVGIALQALGVSEMSLTEHGNGAGREQHTTGAPADRDVVVQVVAHAARTAGERGSGGVATTDLLMGVIHVYGEAFDRVLETHGTDREELLAHLAGQEARAGDAG